MHVKPKTTLSSEFRGWVRDLLAEKGLTLNSLALAACVHQGNLNQALSWESGGKRDVSDEVLAKIAPYLGLTPERLATLADLDRLGGVERIRENAPEVFDTISDPLAVALREIHDRLVGIFPPLEPSMEDYEAFKSAVDDLNRLLEYEPDGPPLPPYTVDALHALSQNPHVRWGLRYLIQGIVKAEAERNLEIGAPKENQARESTSTYASELSDAGATSRKSERKAVAEAAMRNAAVRRPTTQPPPGVADLSKLKMPPIREAAAGDPYDDPDWVKD
jgi:transcriptional regulator with XRE-family HTH domain